MLGNEHLTDERWRCGAGLIVQISCFSQALAKIPTDYLFLWRLKFQWLNIFVCIHKQIVTFHWTPNDRLACTNALGGEAGWWQDFSRTWEFRSRDRQADPPPPPGTSTRVPGTWRMRILTGPAPHFNISCIASSASTHHIRFFQFLDSSFKKISTLALQFSYLLSISWLLAFHSDLHSLHCSKHDSKTLASKSLIMGSLPLLTISMVVLPPNCNP